MATQNGGNSVLAFVLGAALVGLIVLGMSIISGRIAMW
jgi:hypothetical protein